MYGTVFKRKSLTRQVFCIVALFLPSRALSGEDASVTPVQACETVDVQAGEPIVLPVEVFQEKYQFVLDTGCNLSIFDNSFRDRLGKVVKQQHTLTPTGIRPFEHFSSPELKIGLRFPETFRSGDNVACADLSHARMGGRGDEMGIVGMDFLNTRVVRVNFDEGFAQIGHATNADRGQPTRIEMKSGRPWMRLSISSDGYHSFLIDTGNVGEIYLNSKLFARLSSQSRIVLKAPSRGAEIGKEIRLRTGVLDSLEFGNHQFSNIRVCEGTENAIGLNFLSRFDAQFDFPNRIAYFRAGRHITSPDRWNRAGLGVRRIDGRTLAAITDPAGAAAQSGLSDDDEIIEVNGLSANTLSLAQIRRLCSDPDANRLKISFQRSGSEMAVELELSKK